MRLYDDRLHVFVGGTHVTPLTRGRPRPDGRDDSVVSYHHVIHVLRRKPMTQLGLVYRDQLFPREAYRQSFDALLAARPEREACRTTVALLALPSAATPHGFAARSLWQAPPTSAAARSNW